MLFARKHRCESNYRFSVYGQRDHHDADHGRGGAERSYTHLMALGYGHPGTRCLTGDAWYEAIGFEDCANSAIHAAVTSLRMRW
jgi:hypothetical protein